MNRRLQVLRAEHDKVRSAMETIENTAVDAGRDLSQEEESELDTLATRAESIGGELQKAVGRWDNLSATSDIFARLETQPGFAGLQRAERVTAPEMTVGEFTVLYLRAARGDSHAGDVLTRAFVASRQSDVLARALPDDTITSDVTGIIPTLIVGDLTKFVDASRPVIGSMRSLPMPEKGSAFTRPIVTQRTTSAAQSAQVAELTSQHMTVTGTSVSKSTHGGSALLSEQVIDWSDPAIFQIIMEDLADSYAIDTETVAATAVAAAATTEVDGDTTTPQNFYDGMAAGAASVYSTCKRLPNTIYAAVDQWQALIAMLDADDRPLFPNLNPVNAGGQLDIQTFQGNPLGLKLVVSPHFSDGFLAIANAFYLEAYEQNKGAAQVALPTSLSVELAYRGYFATNCRAQGIAAVVPAS